MVKVSIIMTIFNGKKFLHEAIDSVLVQTLKDFELIIIDDGSTDSSLEIVKSYNDKRIKLLINEVNRGQSYSRNRGIKMASGEYIAVMDGDDIMYPNRLEKQVDYLKINGVSICFSWADVIGEDGNWIRVKSLISDPLLICAKLIFECPLIHPTAMWKRESFINNNLWYDEEYVYAQDMELWNRVKEYFDIHIMEEPLIKFRFGNSNSISFQKKDLQNSYALKISSKELMKLDYSGENPLFIKKMIYRIIAVIRVKQNFIKINGTNKYVIIYFRDLLFPPGYTFASYRFTKQLKNWLIN
jgi:glycosyltransferase involved in cell wall biosynthesis